MDEEMKRFLQIKMDREAEEIMKEVENDPNAADLRAPDEIRDKLFSQIEDYKKEMAEKEMERKQEEKELIRLGRIYKKKQQRKKYTVAAAVMVSTLAIGITSIGGAKKAMKNFHWTMGGREEMTLNSDSKDVTQAKVSEEEEAYQNIRDTFGFEPARMYYLPEKMNFQEMVMFEEMKNVQMIYSDGKASLLYQVNTNYRETSIGIDVEDRLKEESVQQVGDVKVEIKTYEVEKKAYPKMTASFEYRDIYYFLVGNGVKEQEFTKIIKNLHFF